MGQVVNFTRRMVDSLTNLVTGMGTVRDKAASSQYALSLWTDQDLLLAYRGAWLPRKIVDIPAFDALRKWRAWQAEEGITELIEAEETRLLLRNKLLECKIKARLFGGAALLIGVRGELDLMQPLEPTRIGKQGILYINVLLRRQLTAGDLDLDPASEFYGRPAWYQLNVNTPTGAAQDVRIHPSRLVVFQGVEQIDYELGTSVVGRGWGDSVLVSCMDAIRRVDATAANIASLVFEAKVDVFRIPDLMASLADEDYKSRLLDRFTLANQAKGISNALMLDKEEEYEQKQAAFAGLPDVLTAFMQLVSGAADIPMTRLLGQSPAGLNATGESDLRNYYDRIQAIQEVEIRPAIARLDECLIRSALGSRPPEVHYIWNSLWQISDKERAEIGKSDAETIAKLEATGLFPPEALAKAATNMLVEHSIFPGLVEEIDAAGGLPDYEALLEEERAAQAAQRPANNNQPRPRQAANDTRFTDAVPRTLYIRRDVLNVADFLEWARAQGFRSILTDLHVTVAYIKTPVDWMKLGTSYGEDEEGRLRVRPGGPRSVERFGQGATVLEFANSELAWRNGDARRAAMSSDLETPMEFPEYRPHITISYAVGQEVDLTQFEPYRGEILLGPEIFEEIKTDWSPEGVRELAL